MVNKAILIGYLGRDPDMIFTPDGTPVTTFSLATNHRWSDELGDIHTNVEWHSIEAWNGLAEATHKYLVKGRLIYVTGRLKTNRWEENGIRQRRTVIVAEDIRFLPTSRGAPAKSFEVEDLPEILPAPVEATEDVKEKPRRNGRKKRSAVEA